MALEFEKGTEAYKINEILREVIDPELNINIVDLGLIYGIKIDEKDKTIWVDMTLSAPGCPLGDVIMNTAYQTVQRFYKGYDISINLVWEPQWTPEMVSEEGKKQLNLL